ncbi:MAG: methyl-accepting chemotaxis protein [Desulfuromonadales bacterium]
MFFRKKYFINKNMQARFILSFIIIVVCWAVATVGVYTYLVARKLDSVRYSSHIDIKTTGDLLLPITIGTHLISLLLFAAILAYVMRSIWQKLSPPLYSIKKDIARIASGDLSSEISLCKGEEFHDLASELEQMRRKLRENILLIKDRQQALTAATVEIDNSICVGKLSMNHVAALQSEVAAMNKSIHVFHY